MTITVRQTIRNFVIDAMNLSVPAGVPTTTLRRYIPGEKLIQPRLAAFFGEEDDRRPGGAQARITGRSLVLVLQAMAGVENPEEIDDALEPLLAHVVEVLGNQDYMGGLSTNVTELSTEWASSSAAGRFYGIAMTRWRIDYQTRRGDLTLKQ